MEGEEGHVEAGLLPICYYMHIVAVRVKAQGGGGHISACAHGRCSKCCCEGFQVKKTYVPSCSPFEV